MNVLPLPPSTPCQAPHANNDGSSDDDCDPTMPILKIATGKKRTSPECDEEEQRQLRRHQRRKRQLRLMWVRIFQALHEKEQQPKNAIMQVCTVRPQLFALN